MRYYSWMSTDPKVRYWTGLSQRRFNAAMAKGDKRLAMRVAAVWQGVIMLDPRYGKIDDLALELLARKIRTGA